MVAASALHNIASNRATGDTIHEDVSSVITNIAPTETPILSMLGKTRAKSDVHYWLRDTLAPAVSTNAHVDGDAFGTNVVGDTTTAPFRLNNRCQISKKQINLPGRVLEGLDLIGRKNEMGYQLSKKAPELKRDIEMAITSLNLPVAEASPTAAQTAGMLQWIATNDVSGVGGSPAALDNGTWGTPVAPGRVNGTNVALSEASLIGVIRDAWIGGGKIDRIFVRPEIKTRMSAYFFQGGTLSARIAQLTQDFGSNPDKGVTVSGAVDVWKSDFGIHLITPCRQQRVDDVLCLDTSKWKIAYLRKYRVKKIPEGGDNELRHLLVDWCLVSLDEAASGIVCDVNDVAMTN